MSLTSYKIPTLCFLIGAFVFLSGCLGPDQLIPQGEGRVLKITSIVNVKATYNKSGDPVTSMPMSAYFYKMKGNAELRRNEVSSWYSDYGTARYAFTYDLRPGEWIRFCAYRGMGPQECQQIISYEQAIGQADEIGQLTVTRQIDLLWH